VGSDGGHVLRAALLRDRRADFHCSQKNTGILFNRFSASKASASRERWRLFEGLSKHLQKPASFRRNELQKKIPC
jgi:hypothetical protein